MFSDWNTIKNNNIVENQLTGIRLYGSNHNLIENNTLKDNICYHIFLRGESNNNTVQNNKLTQSENWLKACDGIWLSHSSNNLIENNEITGIKSGVGISLDSTSSYNVVNKNMIHNNPCKNSSKSIQICNSDFNLVLDNEIRSNGGSGIQMFFSQGNEIIGNTIESLPNDGISLCDCRYNNIIKFNNISSTLKGIDIGTYSSKNIVESNNLINNSYGIYLSGTDLLGFVPNNVIFDNNIVENNYGIYIRVSDYYGHSNDSLIYHNNFINNTQNVYDECNNSWDKGYPSGGNYWDNYNGVDDDGDGIGDTPYNIPGCNDEDRYPLMYPMFNDPPDAPLIDGPTRGKIGYEYEYNFSLSDPDNDSMYLRVDWGNGTPGPWQGPYSSKTSVSLNHTWNQRGTFTIRAQTKDIFGAESEWGELKVRMPKNKPSDLIVKQNRLANTLPILNRNIIQNVGVGYE